MRFSHLTGTGFTIMAAMLAAAMLPASPANAQRRVYRFHPGEHGHYPYIWRHYQRPGAFEFHRWRLPPERRLRYTDTPIAQRWGGYSSCEGLGYPFAEDYSNDSFFRRQVDAHRFDQPVPSGRFEGAAARWARSGVPVVSVSIDQLLQYPAPTLDDPGWGFLGEGEAIRALGRFTGQKMTRPGDALPMIGYGIGAALYGDDRAALQSLRDAMRADPGVVRRFEPSEAVVRRIRGLIDQYTAQTDETDDAQRAKLLAASLHCLLHEYDAASDILADLDEDSSGVRALVNIIAAGKGEGAPDKAAGNGTDEKASAFEEDATVAPKRPAGPN
jgi:hypothetical protein